MASEITVTFSEREARAAARACEIHLEFYEQAFPAMAEELALIGEVHPAMAVLMRLEVAMMAEGVER